MSFLRPVTRADHTTLALMRRDSALMTALMIAPEEAAGEPVDRWIARRQEQGHLWVIADPSNRAVGFVQLAGHHKRNATAWLGIAVSQENRGRGYGARGLEALIELARQMGLRKLKLEVRRDNITAIALYRSRDFRDVGHLVAEFDDGTRVHDTLIMERLL